MLAVFVNMGAVLIGSTLGIIFRKGIKKEHIDVVISALALVTLVIAISSAIQTQNMLCLIVCTAVGTLLGTFLKIDNGIEHAGDFVKDKLMHGKASGRFTEGFLSASILFCIGSMTIMGSFESGINGNHDIIFAKSALDFVFAMMYSAAMGIGVAFSTIFIFVFQGGLTILAGVISPYLDSAVIAEMSAVGGTILIGMGFNMLGFPKERIKVANMLPSIFLPIAYIAIEGLIKSIGK